MTSSATSFPLAPMSGVFRGMSILMLLLPIAFVAIAWAVPPPANWILATCAVFMVVLYAAIWLTMRPTRFEVTADALVIRWPTRSRAIPLMSIQTARVLDHATFRREIGYGMRIGVGGLWGSFGRFRTSTRMFEIWVSRFDPIVLVERADGGLPLLLTPDDPAAFVSALRVTR